MRPTFALLALPGLVAGAALAQAPAATTQAAPPAALAVQALIGGPDFISPMGEPFRSEDKLSGAEHWFAQADANHDGRLTKAEFRADAARFFALLDTDHDGIIGPAEISHYESDIAPEIRVDSTGVTIMPSSDDSGSGDDVKQPPYPDRLGAGRLGYIDLPEPVVSADANFDRGISPGEFARAADKRFASLDTNGDGAITRAELPPLREGRDENGDRPARRRHHRE